MSRKEEITSRLLTVPQMPMPVTRVIGFLQNPNADMHELTRLIEYDPGLTVNVLRMANSPFFSGGVQVSNVKSAIMRLGMQRIFQMVIASGVAPHTGKAVAGYGLAPGELLKHSVAVGLGAESLARQLGHEAPAHTFTSGLLVNIGKIVLGEFLAVDWEPVVEMAHSRSISFERAEEAVLGLNHCEVGALILEKWEIPESIVEVVRWHLSPEETSRRDLVLDLVHVADAIAKMTGIGVGYDGLHYNISEPVVDRIGLTPQALEAVMLGIIENISELSEIFESEA